MGRASTRTRPARIQADKAYSVAAIRAVATRYDKHAFIYLATIDIAIIKIWLCDLAKDQRDSAQ